MRLGSASPATSEAANPAHPFRRRGLALDGRGVDRKPQRKMREHMRHSSGQSPPLRTDPVQTRCLRERVASSEIRRPLRGRHLDHAAEQSLRVAAAQGQHRRYGRARRLRHAATRLEPWAACAETSADCRVRGRRAGLHPRAKHAGGGSSACRCSRRDPSALAQNRRRASAGARLSARCRISVLGCRQLRLDGKQARDHALAIAIDRGRACAEGDRRNGCRGVRPMPGSARRARFICGKVSARGTRPRPWRRRADFAPVRNSPALPRA